MTDGLLGQGREDIFLLTFNEKVERIDPAFLRPGRCVAKVEFLRFGPAEAAEWLRRRCAPAAAPRAETTLAEIYARLAADPDDPRPIGDDPALPAGFASARRPGQAP